MHPPVPFLRLQGYWLQQAGFAIGQRVCIQVPEQFLIITPSEVWSLLGQICRS
ncbi:SymE family type I addiction module toxin [Pseudomonas sp. LRF_L74]|uniref:SymE family type I addiction module toxin n=1 Tax=Pseudomonas sp. LRF_L74 TaxID=3369422 RepID=UPI003F5F16CC